MSTPKPLALVIEDDPIQAEIFVEAITQSGYEVAHIDRGDAAIAYLDNHSPHLVLLDLHLPEVAGTTILQYIREQPHLSHTRVVLASADARMAEVARADSDLVLIKPISFNQLRFLSQRMLPDTQTDA